MSRRMAEVIDQIGRLSEDIRALEQAKRLLIEELGDLDYDQYAGQNFLLKVEPNRRFDKVTARKNLTPEQYESILVLTPDSTTAKKVLGSDYVLTQREYDPKFVVTRMENE